MAPRSSIVWGAKDIANTGGALVSLFGEREELRKEVTRLRHHVSQLAKRLHRREKELEVERGKGRGIVIEVKAPVKVEFGGEEEGARALVEEEVAVAVVRLPSVAPSVAVSESEVAGDMEVAEEMDEAGELVAEVGVAVPEVEVAVAGVRRNVVAEEEIRPVPVARSARMAATMDEVDDDEERCGGDGLDVVGLNYPRPRRLSEVGGWSGRVLRDRVGMEVDGTGDVELGERRRLMALAPKGPSGGWVPAERGKKRKIVPGEWGLNGGRLVVGRDIPTGPRVRAVPVRFGTAHFGGGSLGEGIPRGPRRMY